MLTYRIDEIPILTPCYPLTAYDGKKRVGHVYVYLIGDAVYQKKGRYAYIDDLWVAEEYRGRGSGKRLMAMAQGLAEHHHCYKIVLSTRFHNTRAAKFYLGLGFRYHGHELRKDLGETPLE